MGTTLDYALDYHSRGWPPIPVPAGQKKPVIDGWQKLLLAKEDLPRYFANGVNIGLLLGELSGHLTDVDLDWLEARLLARHFLPHTDRVSGRKGAPRSHGWYITDERAKTKRFEDPLLRGKKDERAVIVEIRSTGAQTVVPPSRHPSGELYEWYEEGEPAIVSSADLLSSVTRLAACALLSRYWQEGKRHDLALALSGTLIRAGWSIETTEHFIIAAAGVAQDNELEDRRRAVHDTAKRLKAGDSATGRPRLVELIPKEISERIISWLDIPKVYVGPDNNIDSISVEDYDWPDPDPIPEGLLPVPQLTQEFIPEPFHDWLTDITDRVQCPLEFPAVAALIAVAGVVGNTISICPKKRDDWKVVPNLWGGVVGRPGLLKSPALAQALKPLHRLMAEHRELHIEAMKEWEIEKMV